MSDEVTSCPLSACFLGLSPSQAEAAHALDLTDVDRASFDLDAAQRAYDVLRGPDETGEHQPSFLDRMLRRVSRSPLSRHGAETVATRLVDRLVAAGVLAAAPTLTTVRDETLHGEVSRSALDALAIAVDTPEFPRWKEDARVRALGGVPEDADRPKRASPRFPALTMPGRALVFLPAELSRVVCGAPYGYGSALALRREIAAVRDAFDLARARDVEQDGPSGSRLDALARTLTTLEDAAETAVATSRVVLVSP